MDNIILPTSNTSRNENALGERVIPSGFHIQLAEITNRDNVTIEFDKYIESMTIVEELYSPVISCKINIRDEDNMFTTHNLSGQEFIKLHIIKHSPDGLTDSELKLTFVVKEYYDFSRGSDVSLQTFKLQAVSPFAYVSRITSLSIPVKENPIVEMQRIFSKYLGVNNFIKGQEFECVTQFKGVIIRQTPLQGINWLKSKCFDQESSPFLVYSTIKESVINFRSWASLINKKNKYYDQYNYNRFEKERPGTSYHAKEASHKIISFNSNLNLNKLQKSVEGGNGNILHTYKYNERERQVKVYDPVHDELEILPVANSNDNLYDLNHLKEIKEIEDLEVLNNREKFLHTSIINLHQPPPLYTENDKSVIDIKQEYIQKVICYNANRENISHEVKLYGDFNLNPGVKIRLSIPKLIKREDGKEDVDDAEDPVLSGEYIIAVAAHGFTAGVYTTILKVIKDNI